MKTRFRPHHPITPPLRFPVTSPCGRYRHPGHRSRPRRRRAPPGRSCSWRWPECFSSSRWSSLAFRSSWTPLYRRRKAGWMPFLALVLLMAGEMGLSADDPGVCGGAVRHPLETASGEDGAGSCSCPLLWLGWQFVSATGSISPKLTAAVVAHFSACVAFFYLGFFALRGVRNPWPVWAGLGLAFVGSCILPWSSTLAAWRRPGKILDGRQDRPEAGTIEGSRLLGKIKSDRVFRLVHVSKRPGRRAAAAAAGQLGFPVAGWCPKSGPEFGCCSSPFSGGADWPVCIGPAPKRPGCSWFSWESSRSAIRPCGWHGSGF